MRDRNVQSAIQQNQRSQAHHQKVLSDLNRSISAGEQSSFDVEQCSESNLDRDETQLQSTQQLLGAGIRYE